MFGRADLRIGVSGANFDVEVDIEVYPFVSNSSKILQKSRKTDFRLRMVKINVFAIFSKTKHFEAYVAS